MHKDAKERIVFMNNSVAMAVAFCNPSKANASSADPGVFELNTISCAQETNQLITPYYLKKDTLK